MSSQIAQYLDRFVAQRNLVQQAQSLGIQDAPRLRKPELIQRMAPLLARQGWCVHPSGKLFSPNQCARMGADGLSVDDVYYDDGRYERPHWPQTYDGRSTERSHWPQPYDGRSPERLHWPQPYDGQQQYYYPNTFARYYNGRSPHRLHWPQTYDGRSPERSHWPQTYDGRSPERSHWPQTYDGSAMSEPQLTQSLITASLNHDYDQVERLISEGFRLGYSFNSFLNYYRSGTNLTGGQQRSLGLAVDRINQLKGRPKQEGQFKRQAKKLISKLY